MHPSFPVTPDAILWTLTFAAQLVLLVVLLGRERAQRFPWFATSIVVVGLRVLVGRVLANRLPRLTFGAIVITLADVGIIVGALVLAEIARHVFRGSRRKTRILAALAMLVVGAVVLRFWGSWPAWKTLTANSRMALLLFMQLAAQKGELLLGLVTIQLGVLVALFGHSRGAGWRSHAQRIMIGLSTVALAQISVQAVIEILAKHAVPKTHAEYEHLLDLADRIANAEKAVYFLVLVWWIGCLWKDEPGATVALPAETITEPDSAGPTDASAPASADGGGSAAGPPG